MSGRQATGEPIQPRSAPWRRKVTKAAPGCASNGGRSGPVTKCAGAPLSSPITIDRRAISIKVSATATTASRSLSAACGPGSYKAQAPYPTTRSRGPAVSPELRRSSRSIVMPRRRAASSRPRVGTWPQAPVESMAAMSKRSIASAVRWSVAWQAA